jgi:hypothetical protein
MEIRKVSPDSLLALPREFAGKFVSVEKIAEGVLQIKTEAFIPDSEHIFHTREYQERLKRFDKWMDQHDPEESDLDELFRDMKNDDGTA